MKREGSCVVWLLFVVSLMVVALSGVRLTSAYWTDRTDILKLYGTIGTNLPVLAKQDLSCQELSAFDRAGAMLSVLSFGDDTTIGHSLDEIEKISATERMRTAFLRRIHERFALWNRNHFEYRYFALGTGNTVLYIPAQIPKDRTKYVVNVATDGMDQWHVLTKLLE